MIHLLLILSFCFSLTLNCSYTVYFGGELFDHKDLAGNILLAQAIKKQSEDNYHCVLPQDIEVRVFDRIEIRNQDLLALINADLALFNFDGTDLDSGTVVEFMIAKMLDIPAVIVRTDFREFHEVSNDQQEQCNENWNLMASGYPRTMVVSPQLLGWYRHHGLEKTIQLTADNIVNAFNTLLSTKSALAFDKQELLAHYKKVINLCGSDLSLHFSDETLNLLLERKMQLGLY